MESIHVICTTWSYEEIKKVSQEPYWPFIFQKRRLQAIWTRYLRNWIFLTFGNLGLEGKNAFLH